MAVIIISCFKFRNTATKDPYNCFEKIGFKIFFERHFEFKSLDKKEKDLSIKALLMIFQFENENSHIKYQYKYNATTPICQPVFLKLCDPTTEVKKNSISTSSCLVFPHTNVVNNTFLH